MDHLSPEYIAKVRRLRRLARQARMHGHYVWTWQLLTAIGDLAGPYTAYLVEDDNATSYN